MIPSRPHPTTTAAIPPALRTGHADFGPNPMTDEPIPKKIENGDLLVPANGNVGYRVYCVEHRTVYLRGPDGPFAAARRGVEKDLVTGKLKRHPREG